MGNYKRRFVNKQMLAYYHNKVKALLDLKSDKTHTHKYAGSETVGGVANSAHKLETGRTVTLIDDMQGEFTFDGTKDLEVNVAHYRVNCTGGNTANYPWHRIAKVDKVTASWADKDALISIRQTYNGGNVGLLKVSLRTNNVTNKDAPSCDVRWIFRTELFSKSDVKVAYRAENGACYMDLFLKCGAYPRIMVTQVEGDRTITLVESAEENGTTTSSKGSSKEVYKTIESAATEIHNAAYTTIKDSVDDLLVDRSNLAATLARNGDFSYPMTFNWDGKDGQPTWIWGGDDGTNMYVYNPLNFNVNHAVKSAGLDTNTITDWNAAITDGIYVGNNASNAPVANCWIYGHVITHTNNKYVRQIVYRFAGNSSDIADASNDVYERVCNNGSWGSWKNTSVRQYLPLAGGTMTGKLNMKANDYEDKLNTGQINMNNSDIYGINSLKFADLCDSAAEGIQWYRDETHVDSLWDKNGVLYYTPNRVWGTASKADDAGTYTMIHSKNYDSYALPLSGGTMSGDIAFKSIDDTATSNKITWSGSTDGADIYYRTDAKDAGRLVFNLWDDTNTRIDFALNGTTKSYIDANGNFSGKANTAGTADVATTANNVAWGDVGDKPTSYTPSSHKQAYTAAECTEYTSDDNTMGLTPSAVKKAIREVFEPKAHNHGLLHSDFTQNIDATSGGWSLINSNYSGFLLKSIRTNTNAPSWSIGNFSAAIAFGGADTKGVITHAYDKPLVRFAGGNGTSPKWNIALSGTTDVTYSLDNLLYAGYKHSNEINFKGGTQRTCFFNYRNADTDSAATTNEAVAYSFCNYTSSTEKTTIIAANFQGNASSASTASKLDGFKQTNTSQTWGNQTGTFIFGMDDDAGGSIAFRKNNPSAGQLSVIIDGKFYQSEGKNMVLDSSDVSISPTSDGGAVVGGSSLNGTVSNLSTMCSALTASRSFMGTVSGVSDGGDGWQNIISVRHRNGVTDGSSYGLYLRSNLTSKSADLIWNRNYGTGNWQGERTILDSATTSVRLEHLYRRSETSSIGAYLSPFNAIYSNEYIIHSANETTSGATESYDIELNKTSLVFNHTLVKSGKVEKKISYGINSSGIGMNITGVETPYNFLLASTGLSGRYDSKYYCYNYNEFELPPAPDESNNKITNQVTAHDGYMDLVYNVPSSVAGTEINQHVTINGQGISGFTLMGSDTTKKYTWSLTNDGVKNSNGFKSLLIKTLSVKAKPNTDGNIWFTDTVLYNMSSASLYNVIACVIESSPYVNSPFMVIPCMVYDSSSGKYHWGCHLMRAGTSHDALTNWNVVSIKVYYN